MDLFKKLGEILKPQERDIQTLSECCGEIFNEDYGICPECKDHCVGTKWDMETGQEVTNE